MKNLSNGGYFAIDLLKIGVVALGFALSLVNIRAQDGEHPTDNTILTCASSGIVENTPLNFNQHQNNFDTFATSIFPNADDKFSIEGRRILKNFRLRDEPKFRVVVGSDSLLNYVKRHDSSEIRVQIIKRIQEFSATEIRDRNKAMPQMYTIKNILNYDLETFNAIIGVCENFFKKGDQYTFYNFMNRLLDLHRINGGIPMVSSAQIIWDDLQRYASQESRRLRYFLLDNLRFGYWLLTNNFQQDQTIKVQVTDILSEWTVDIEFIDIVIAFLENAPEKVKTICDIIKSLVWPRVVIESKRQNIMPLITLLLRGKLDQLQAIAANGFFASLTANKNVCDVSSESIAIASSLGATPQERDAIIQDWLLWRDRFDIGVEVVAWFIDHNCASEKISKILPYVKDLITTGTDRVLVGINLEHLLDFSADDLKALYDHKALRACVTEYRALPYVKRLFWINVVSKLKQGSDNCREYTNAYRYACGTEGDAFRKAFKTLAESSAQNNSDASSNADTTTTVSENRNNEAKKGQFDKKQSWLQNNRRLVVELRNKIPDDRRMAFHVNRIYDISNDLVAEYPWLYMCRIGEILAGLPTDQMEAHIDVKRKILNSIGVKGTEDLGNQKLVEGVMKAQTELAVLENIFTYYDGLKKKYKESNELKRFIESSIGIFLQYRIDQMRAFIKLIGYAPNTQEFFAVGREIEEERRKDWWRQVDCGWTDKCYRGHNNHVTIICPEDDYRSLAADGSSRSKMEFCNREFYGNFMRILLRGTPRQIEAILPLFNDDLTALYNTWMLDGLLCGAPEQIKACGGLSKFIREQCSDWRASNYSHLGMYMVTGYEDVFPSVEIYAERALFIRALMKCTPEQIEAIVSCIRYFVYDKCFDRMPLIIGMLMKIKSGDQIKSIINFTTQLSIEDRIEFITVFQNASPDQIAFLSKYLGNFLLDTMSVWDRIKIIKALLKVELDKLRNKCINLKAEFSGGKNDMTATDIVAIIEAWGSLPDANQKPISY